MPKEDLNCPHENTHLEVIEAYCTCEVVVVVCDDCDKKLKTVTDC